MTCPNYKPYDHHPSLYDPAEHQDDGYGGCVICLFYVPHTDDDYERVPFPCVVVREAEVRAESYKEGLKRGAELLRDAVVLGGPRGEIGETPPDESGR